MTATDANGVRVVFEFAQQMIRAERQFSEAFETLIACAERYGLDRRRATESIVQDLLRRIERN